MGIQTIKRVEIVLYFNYRNDIKKYLANLGVTVEYFNKKAGYAVLYVDDSNVGKTVALLKKMKGFKRYEISQDELVSFPLEEGLDIPAGEENKDNCE